MACFFFDIDGTLCKHGTQELLPGALETLTAIKAAGHEIILTTYRSGKFLSPPFSTQATYEMLRLNQVPYDHILFDIESPRIVINDDGARAVEVERDSDVNVAYFKDLLDQIQKGCI